MKTENKGRSIQEIAKDLARLVPLAYGEREIDALTLAWEASKKELEGDEYEDIWLRVFALFDEAERSLLTDEWLGAIGERWAGLIVRGQYVDLRARADDLHRDIEASIEAFSGVVTEIGSNRIVEEILQEHLGGANSTRTVKHSLGLLKSQSPDWFLQWEENASEKQVGWVMAGKACGLGVPDVGEAWLYYERAEAESNELKATALKMDLPALGSEILEALTEQTEDLWTDLEELAAAFALQSVQRAIIEHLLLQDRTYGYPYEPPKPRRSIQKKCWEAIVSVLFEKGTDPPELRQDWNDGVEGFTTLHDLFEAVDDRRNKASGTTRRYLRNEANAGRLRPGVVPIEWPMVSGGAGLELWVEFALQWIESNRP